MTILTIEHNYCETHPHFNEGTWTNCNKIITKNLNEIKKFY